MKKPEFTAALRKRLSGLPKKELEESILFYHEMIDDRIEEGMGEQEAIADIGGVDKVASEIVESIPLSRLVKERIKPNRALKVWEIVLILLGSPIWLSLIAVVFALTVSIYAVLWSLVISLWAVFAAFALSAPSGVICGVAFAFSGDILFGALLTVSGMIAAGISIFSFFLCKSATVGAAILSKKTVLLIKKIFVMGERA